MNLGTLQKVNLRTAWPHEALDFTRWLCNDENIGLLCAELDIVLEEIKLEQASGRYNVDIVAKEANTARTVIIENQLEITDHKHLGQILTYASAHDASIIIWIVKDYNEEHKQAIDWFNRHMPETISFFLIQLELWQIGTSLPAPRFHIICEPNNWAKTMKVASTTENTTLSDLKLQQQRFWEGLKEYAAGKTDKSIINLGRSPRPQHWYNISYGTSKAHISLTFNSRQEYIGCEIYVTNDGAYYQQLSNNKEQIETELNMKLDWQDLPESNAFRIITTYSCQPTNEARWPEYFDWLLRSTELFTKTFKKFK